MLIVQLHQYNISPPIAISLTINDVGIYGGELEVALLRPARSEAAKAFAALPLYPQEPADASVVRSSGIAI